jgi:hypothetical protein
MTPLQKFIEIINNFHKRPFKFLAKDTQKMILVGISNNLNNLKKILGRQKLSDTQVYNNLLNLEKTYTNEDINEVAFLQELSNLIEVYRLSSHVNKIENSILILEEIINYLKPRLISHHLLLEKLLKKEKGLSEEQKRISDLGTIQKVGIFYVLEYTLQVLFEFKNLPDGDKMKLLSFGLQTTAGNLPAYLPLEETFRQELCYRIYSEKLRHQLLEVFYNWEDVFYDKSVDFERLVLALKEFNLAVLRAFKDFGFTNFKAAIYAPWGNNFEIHQLMLKINDYGQS